MVADAVTLSAQIMTAVLKLVSAQRWPSVRSALEGDEASPQAVRFYDEISSVAEVLSDPSGTIGGLSRRYVLQTCESNLRDLLQETPELASEFQRFIDVVEAALPRIARTPTESSRLIQSYTDASIPQISIGTILRVHDSISDERQYIGREFVLAHRSELLPGTHMEFSGDRAGSVQISSPLPQSSLRLSIHPGLVEPPFELLPHELYGKDEALADLEAGLDQPDGKVHLFSGEPGAGKRIAALAVAANAKKRGKRVWWVRGTPELIGACMTAIAVELNADLSELAEARAGHRSLPDLVWDCLERAAVPWLLVFDDVENIAALKRFLSSDRTGSGWIRPSKVGGVLVTTRGSDEEIAFHHLEIHEIKAFGLEDAVRFLRSSAPAAGAEDDAAGLAEYLCCLPLPCKLSASYIISSMTTTPTFHEYLAELRKLKGKWLPSIPQDDQDPWLALSVRIIFQSMNRPEHASAWALLAILAYFAPGAPLARSILDPGVLADIGLPGWAASRGKRRRILADSFKLLVSLGLVESAPIPAEGTYSVGFGARMHPVIATSCRFIVENKKHVAGVRREQVWIAAATLLHRAADRESKEENRYWPAEYQLTPHISAMILNLPSAGPPAALEEAIYAARMAIAHLAQTGSHLRAEQIGRRAIELSRNLPEGNPASLGVTYDLARILMNRGRLGEAQELLQAMLATSQLTGGLDSKASVDALELLASLLYQRGEIDQAEQILRQVTRARERADGPDSAATVHAVTALARILNEQGKLDEMERLTREVLSSVRHRYGVANRTTLSAETRLGATFRELGRLSESEQILRQVLDVQETLLGPDDLDTCKTMVELAEAFRDMGQLNLARGTCTEVVARRSRVLGPDDLETVNAQAQLAETLRDQARFDESAALLQHVLDVRRQTLGAEHPETLNARLGLAVLLRDTGQLAKAESILDEVMAICEKVLRNDHPVALSARHNLATVLQATGRIEQAEQLYRDVLDKREWTLGPNHPETLRTLVNLGSLLRLRGSLGEAEHTLRQAEAAYAEIYGPSHPHTMTVLTNIANVLFDSGMVLEAKDSYLEILEIQRSILGHDHPDTLITRVNLAVALAALGDLHQADLLLTEAAAAYLRVFGGPNHPCALKARYHLANLKERKGQFQVALDSYLTILNLQTKILGTSHPDAIATRLSVSRVLETLGRYQESDAEYQYAIRLASPSSRRLSSTFDVIQDRNDFPAASAGLR